MSGHEEFSFNPNKYIRSVDSEKSKKKKILQNPELV